MNDHTPARGVPPTGIPVPPTRREVVAGIVAGTTLGCTGRPSDVTADVRPEPAPRSADGDPLMPSAFVSHGAPSLALDAVGGADLARWGQGLVGLRGILVVSAHWEETPLALGTIERRPLYHDYGGFAPELREVIYDAPAAPELARRVEGLLKGAPGGVARSPERPWDHGVWVPLVHVAPAADVPLLQLSLPSQLTPAQLIDVGRRLASLREEGVLVLGSGGAVHNLRRLDWNGGAGPPTWATEFEGWLRDAAERFDVEDLAALRERAPALRLAHPTEEHLLPFLVAFGAATASRKPAVTFPVEGFEYGSLSRLAAQFA